MPPEIDAGTIAADLSSELFGGSAPSSTGGDPPGVGLPADPPLGTEAPAPAYTPRPLPQSWKKELEPHWQKLPKEIHDFVYDREGNVSRGIQMYRDGHEKWNKLTTPYKQVWETNPDVDPFDLAHRLLQGHMALSFAPKEKRKELLKEWMKAYEVDDETPGTAPDVSHLVQQAVQQAVAPIQERERNRLLAETTAKVEAFFADPANEFAADLQADILAEIQRGERDLKAAYERAMWLNPQVRAKVLAKQAGGAPSPGTNLQTRRDAPPAPPAPRKGGSIEDTVDAVADRLFNRSSL